MENTRRPPFRSPRIFAYGTEWPTSWTTVLSVKKGTSVLLSFLGGISTSAGAYDCEVALLAPDGVTRVQLSKDSVANAGEEVSVLYLREGQMIPVEAGWSVQLKGTAANAVSYLVAGYEEISL